MGVRWFALTTTVLAVSTLGAGCADDGAAGPCPETPCAAGSLCQEGLCVDQLDACPAGYVRVEAGAFVMGSPTSEPQRGSDEVEHTVTLTRPLCVKATEVTQAEFEAIVGYNPSSATACGGTCPVEKVRWMEATAYCNALSRRDGLSECYSCTGAIDDLTLVCQAKGDPYACEGYRLPTEAEWEYAARADSTTAFPNGAYEPAGFCESQRLESVAWFCGNSDNAPHPVGQKGANAWGLFDTAGNVFEWCHDDVRVSGDEPTTDPDNGLFGTRATRGGAYDSNPEACRSASRTKGEPGVAVQDQGFRPVRFLR